MEKIRDWAFPVGTIVGWMIAAAYTLSLMLPPPAPREVPPQPAEAIVAEAVPR